MLSKFCVGYLYSSTGQSMIVVSSDKATSLKPRVLPGKWQLLKTHRVVLLRLESRKVLEHRWRLADQPLLRIQVDHVLPAVLKDLESLEVRANQQVLAAHRAPANLSTNKRPTDRVAGIIHRTTPYNNRRNAANAPSR